MPVNPFNRIKALKERKRCDMHLSLEVGLGVRNQTANKGTMFEKGLREWLVALKVTEIQYFSL